MLRVPRPIDHKHIRTYDFGAIFIGATDTGYSSTFTLGSLPNHTEFTTLYDLYRIDAVEVIWELVPLVTQAMINKRSNIMPVILAWQDDDDATAPTTLNQVNQVSRMERLELSEARPAIKRLIVPKLQLGTAGSSPNVGVCMPPRFLDCAYDNVLHYGLKYWVKNFNTTTVAETGAGLNLSFRYHLTMRNPQ